MLHRTNYEIDIDSLIVILRNNINPVSSLKEIRSCHHPLCMCIDVKRFVWHIYWGVDINWSWLSTLIDLESVYQDLVNPYNDVRKLCQHILLTLFCMFLRTFRYYEKGQHDLILMLQVLHLCAVTWCIWSFLREIHQLRVLIWHDKSFQAVKN